MFGFGRCLVLAFRTGVGFSCFSRGDGDGDGCWGWEEVEAVRVIAFRVSGSGVSG
ncbi:hypothetical protein M758_8G071200 [Ceratodon purpureus]|uniref:Uncharacterized protein n=1 Tax=Ceratodon purpureus TaxID=3225 RepID=A0A8T0GW79_CERPU|nr:hypothetical protein KC19_8G076000 [Ceratodon purpureus]KAG0608011.1 hypothetical protein M758_8G071200 [Ceratodon purpureus]